MFTQRFDNGKILVTDHGYGVEIQSRNHADRPMSFWLQGDDYIQFMDFVDSYSPELWISFDAYLTVHDYDLLFQVECVA